MRLIGFLLLVSLPLTAQFSALSTDDSGSQAWFSTPLQLRGSSQGGYANIFTSDSEGNLTLVATNPPYDLIATDASGDGSVLAYTGIPGCHVLGAGCQYIDALHGTVSAPAGQLIENGIFHVSRNGRYALHDSYYYQGPTEQIETIDLASMQRNPISVGDFYALAGGGRLVSSTGAVLAYAESILWLFQLDGSATFITDQIAAPFEAPFYGRAALDDAADRVVYQLTDTPTGRPCQIDLVTPSANTTPSVLVSSNQPCTLESLSPDGATVLFIGQSNFDGSNPSGLAQAWIVDTSSAAIHAVTSDVAGISEATLSGDASVVWAVTFGGRLLRINRSAGATQQIISQTVEVDQPWDSEYPTGEPLVGAPGMLVHVTGQGLAPQFTASTIPLSTSLGGTQLLLDGQTVPLFSVSPTDIVFQVPWEVQAGTNHTITLPETQSPFEGSNSRNLQVVTTDPSFWPSPDGSASVLHQDFHGPVSLFDPAQPDEILHVYATGLGPVTPPVPDGQPAASVPLSTLQFPAQLTWGTGSTSTEANALFAGLAPGLVGVEQIDVQAPQSLPAIGLSQITLSFSIGPGAVVWFRQTPDTSKIKTVGK
jgi:uncharacterized protein (TIGR03437 family)